MILLIEISDFQLLDIPFRNVNYSITVVSLGTELFKSIIRITIAEPEHDNGHEGKKVLNHRLRMNCLIFICSWHIEILHIYSFS